MFLSEVEYAPIDSTDEADLVGGLPSMRISWRMSLKL